MTTSDTPRPRLHVVREALSRDPRMRAARDAASRLAGQLSALTLDESTDPRIAELASRATDLAFDLEALCDEDPTA